jgi:hypothetical protein
MSVIPLRALTGRKYRNSQTGGYAPLNREDNHDEHHVASGSGTGMAAARVAASVAATYNINKKGKGGQQRYIDDTEEEENLLNRGDYGDDNDGDETAEETTLLRREPSVESVSCTKLLYPVL